MEHKITVNYNVSCNNLYWERIWIRGYGKPKQCLKKHRHHFVNKATYSQGYGLSSSHVQIWELDRYERYERRLSNEELIFPTVVLEKTLENSLDSKEIKQVNPKGNQPWMFIGRVDSEGKAPILWPPDAESWLIGKDIDARKDWRQENRAIENEMVDGITNSMYMNLDKLQEMVKASGRPGVLQSTGLKRGRDDLASEQ